MFASGTTDQLKKPGRKMAGMDTLRVSTNEQGIPITWFCGRARVGITYISRMFDVVKTKVKSGKKGAIKTYKYSAGFAGLIGFGPVDRIFHVITQDDLIWSEDPMAPTERPSAGTDYVDLTITDLGTLRLYWGTNTQVADSGLVYEGITHPAYRGYSYVRSLRWYLGQFAGGDIPAGNIELLVGRYPVPSWWVLPSVKIGQDINPGAALWDLCLPGLKNGLDTDLVDTDSLLELSEICADESFGLSPVISQNKTWAECALEILQHFDGFYRQNADGKIFFGVHRPPVVSVPDFGPDQLTTRPKIAPGSWTQTSSGVQVRFRNGQVYLNDDVASSFDRANFAVTGRPDAPTIDRPFITDPDLAQFVANALSQRKALPSGSGSFRILKDELGSLLPGDQFTLTYPKLWTGALPLIAETIKYPDPGRPEVEIEFISDLTQTNAGNYTPPAYVAPTSALRTPVLTPLQFGFELLGDGAPDITHTWFGFAAVAPTPLHNGFFIWREFPDGSGDYVDTVDEYASWTPELYIVGASITNVATTFEVYLGPEAALGGMLGIGDDNFDSFPTADIDAGKVYLALDCGGFGDPVEIVRVTALVPGSGPGKYAVTVVRAQWSTTGVAHDGWNSSGVQSVCALFNSDELAKVDVDSAFATERFLLQPAIAGRRADITTLTPIEIDLSVNPTSPPANLRVFGDRLNPNYTTGQDIVVAWDATVIDPDRSDLVARTATDLEFYDATGVTLKATIHVGATLLTYTWTNAALVTALGSETNFHIRAYQLLDGARSSTYVTIQVLKV